ncbi:MAG: hypothetical protein AAGI38_09435, partial [Bacteroidota bacterium]
NFPSQSFKFQCSTSLPLVEAFRSYPGCKVFEIVDADSRGVWEWKVRPTDLEVLPHTDTTASKHFFVKAWIIDHKGKISPGYMDVILPERISDFVVHNLHKPIFSRTYEISPWEVVPAVASDCPGTYDFYYSHRRPEVGINTLKNGLMKGKKKQVAAADLAYILRDENLKEEALTYFLMAEKSGPFCFYICWEIAELYRALGREDKANVYQEKFDDY